MKKTMKKFAFITVLIVMMTAVMAGCQKQQEKTSSKTNTAGETKKTDDSNNKPEVKENDKVKGKENDKVKGKENEGAKENDKAKGEHKETDLPYEAGTISDQGFESKWMDLKFTLPENCTMATADEIKSFFNQGADQMHMTEEQKAAADKVTYEMMVINNLNQANITVMTEKLSFTSMTEDTYLKSSQKTLEQVGGGMYQISDQITDAAIAGQPFKKGSMTAAIQGVTLNQDTYVRKIGGYMVLITASCQNGNEDALNTMLAAFQPYS